MIYWQAQVIAYVYIPSISISNLDLYLIYLEIWLSLLEYPKDIYEAALAQGQERHKEELSSCEPLWAKWDPLYQISQSWPWPAIQPALHHSGGVRVRAEAWVQGI